MTSNFASMSAPFGEGIFKIYSDYYNNYGNI